MRNSLDKFLTIVLSLWIGALMLGALVLLAVLLSGCAHPPVVAVTPIEKIVLTQDLDGEIPVCIVAPDINASLKPRFYGRTVCLPLDTLRQWYARQQGAE